MGFKAFMSPSRNDDDFENSAASVLRAAMREIAPTGLRLALHAEDPATLDAAAARLERTETAADWLASRPVDAEIKAVELALDLAGETGCPITIVHVSAPEVLEVIRRARRNGADILCETCPHYLLLTAEDAALVGPNAKCAPPLRPPETGAALNRALLDGWIDTLLGPLSQPCGDEGRKVLLRRVGRDRRVVQHGLPLLIDRYGLDAAAELQALQMPLPRDQLPLPGWSPRVGLEVGCDADFVLVRPLPERRTIEEADLLYRNPLCVYWQGLGARTGEHLAARRSSDGAGEGLLGCLGAPSLKDWRRTNENSFNTRMAGSGCQ